MKRKMYRLENEISKEWRGRQEPEIHSDTMKAKIVFSYSCSQMLGS